MEKTTDEKRVRVKLESERDFFFPIYVHISSLSSFYWVSFLPSYFPLLLPINPILFLSLSILFVFPDAVPTLYHSGKPFTISH